MSDQETLSLEFPERVDDGSLWVPGRPRPKGSAAWVPDKRTGKPVQKRDKKSIAWEKTVAFAAWQWWGPEPALEGPVGLTLIFYFKRPLNHFRTGKFAGMLKSNAPACYIETPDADKVARNICDALGGKIIKREPLIYLDDKQVGPLSIDRRYCDADNPDEGVRIYLLGFIDDKAIGSLPGVHDA